MSLTLTAKCPGCKKNVRLPEEWANRTVRCKNCGLVSQATPNADAIEKKRPPVPPSSPATAPASAQAVATASIPAVVAYPNPNASTAFVPPPAATGHHADPFGFDDLLDQPQAAVAGKPGNYRRKKKSWMPLLVMAGIVGLLGALITVGAKKVKDFVQASRSADANSSAKNGLAGLSNDPSNANATAIQPQFPRRILGICVNNYLYANPISYGYDPTSATHRDFSSLLTRFSDKLKIPRSQVYELSDGAIGRSDYVAGGASGSQRIPTMLRDWRQLVDQADKAGSESPPVPLKPIIEQTIAKFAETSRPQDRVVLIFVGHAAEIDGKVYLAPMEADLDDAKTMIPLDFVYQQLDKCPAQQKLFIVDVGRFDKARGLERPNGGKMSAKTEAALRNPPAGVQVWSACSADQYSYEFDDYASYQGSDIKGGAFLSLFFRMFQNGTGVIPRPEEPIPVDLMAAKVNEDVKKMSEVTVDDEKKGKSVVSEQTPFLAGKPKEESIAYNPEEPLAAHVAIPTPAQVFAKGLAPRRDVTSLIAEIQLPPIKPGRSTDSDTGFGGVVPFSAEVMDKYRSDGKTVAEIMKNPDQFALRIATIKAIEKLREISRTGNSVLTEEVRAPANDAEKAKLRTEQRGPATVMNDLREVMEDLEKVGEDRKEEKSKRWQIHYDFALAMVKAKYAYTHEYSLMAGEIRRDVLPELPKGQGWGWRLASSGTMKSNTDVKDMVKDARKLLQKIIKENPGTPWEVWAKRSVNTQLGLKWEPTNFGGGMAMSMDK